MEDAEHIKAIGYNCKCKCKISNIAHSEKHDAYFCKNCDTWVELKCLNPSCSLCKGRPEKPSEVKNG